MSDYNANRKRARYTINSTNAGPLNQQRNSTWGIYATGSTFINPYYPQQNSIIQLPPSEAMLMNELGGNQSLTNQQGGQSNVYLSAGLGGCQKAISHGLFDQNGYYNFTEENSIVQLLAYRFKPNPLNNNTQFVECVSCLIDMGALKLNLTNAKNVSSRNEIIQRLQQELCFALICQQAISWPRFCMWNSSIAPGGTNQACNCKPWMPQGNPVDDSFGNDGFTCFSQNIPPLLNIRLTGLSQLTISVNLYYINYVFNTYGVFHPWMIQLMTPRLNGVLDKGVVPMSNYINSTLVDGNHGWFRRGCYVFGFGYFNDELNSYSDIYEKNNWSTTQFSNTIGYDFSVNPTQLIPYDPLNDWKDINIFCKSRFLQFVVVANMPCTLTSSRFYYITSHELSLNQVKSFISSVDKPGPSNTIGILWDDVINGNNARNISGYFGYDEGKYSYLVKELNPMFNQQHISLNIISEWQPNSFMTNDVQIQVLRNENSNLFNVKNNSVYKACYIPFISGTPPTDQNGVVINPIIKGIPYSIYVPYIPPWMDASTVDPAIGFNNQFDILKYCRNRCLVSFSYKNNSAPYIYITSPTEISTIKPYEDISNSYWQSTLLQDGNEKPAATKVHLTRIIGF